MRFRLAAIAAVIATTALAAQEPQTPRFRVAVDAVRIDAVVTDKDGNIVKDLTADDFEVLQDGKKQTVTFAEYVPILSAALPATPAKTPLKGNPVVGAPPLPAAGAVRREHIQRTIAIVVDDLGMSVESLFYVKRGINEFIDRGTQPGDLIALVRTGGSMDGLQPFTTDRRILHAAVDNLKHNAFSRSGVEAFPAVNEFDKLTDVPHGPGGGGQQTDMIVGDFTALDAVRNNVMAAGTLGALNLVIQGAKDLPGRKAVLFVSEGFEVLEKGSRDTTSQPGRVRTALDRTVDQATRAGVVIYSIDARGLQTGAMVAGDDFNSGSGKSAESFRSNIVDRMDDRNGMRRDTQEGMAYLAEQTGGFAVLNSNNLGAGLTSAAQDVRDYYVIGYAPDANTFAPKGSTPEYHKITVKVRRPGLKVRTRKEFLGVSDADETAAVLSPSQQLVNAAISPFTATDIALRATPLPGYSPDRGLFVRALLLIDASALTFAKDEDGKAIASADVLGMVFDKDGTEVAHLSTAFSAALTNEGAQDALRDGLAYTLRIPIPHAGPYQMRFAVRDRHSDKLGTAGEFVEIPDIPHGAFALSGIVMRVASDASAAAADADRIVISPSQAIRSYQPGTELKYAYEIYNAATPVQITMSVWRGPVKVVAGTPVTLTPPAGRGEWFSAGGGFRLGEHLAPGSYVLQVAASTTDPAKPTRVNRAVQYMDFEVRQDDSRR